MSQVRVKVFSFQWPRICRLTFIYFFSQPTQEDEQTQRPAVREEDLTEAKNKLGGSGSVKGKTFEVMEECGEDDFIHVNTFMVVLFETMFTTTSFF